MTAPARDYLRVSYDHSGRGRSLDEQHADNQGDAEANGREIRKSYADRSVSASRYSTKTRDGYAEVIADLEAGDFEPDEWLILWVSSRGSRRVGEWVLLCDLAAEQHVLIRVTTHHRTYDPRNPRDRRTLLEDAVDSEYESGKMSQGIRRALAADAAAGEPPGRGAFGHPRNVKFDGKLVAVSDEQIAAEAQGVRDTYAGFFAGKTLVKLASELNARGLRNTHGGKWGRVGVRHMLLNPRNAGLRYYKGERVAVGKWDRLVPEETWQSAVHKLNDPQRTVNQGNARKWIGSGLYWCGKCDESTMEVCYSGGSRLYRCAKHNHNFRNGGKTDAYVRAVIFHRLDNEDVVSLLGADEGEELSSLHASAGPLRERLDSLGADYAEGQLTLGQMRVATQRLEHRLAEIDERIAAIGRRSQLASMLSTGNPGQQFLDAELDVQCATIDAIAVVTILPTYRGSRRPISESVRIEPRSPE